MSNTGAMKKLCNEKYMCDYHLEYFKEKLITMKNDAVRENQKLLHEETNLSAISMDFAEKAEIEHSNSVSIAARVRRLQKIENINDALQKIYNGKYGFCDNSGKDIGIKRLDFDPTASLCIEEQRKMEE